MRCAQAQQRELQTRCAEAQAALAAAGEALQEEEARLEAAVADMSARTHALDAANRRLQQLTVGMVAEDTSACAWVPGCCEKKGDA